MGNVRRKERQRRLKIKKAAAYYLTLKLWFYSKFSNKAAAFYYSLIRISTMQELRRVSIDIETYSDVDLKKNNVYLYVKSPDFDILFITFKFDDLPTIYTIDTTKLDEPEQQSNLKFLKAILMNNSILKVAYNATFERVCLSTYFNIKYDATYWRCTLVKGARAGLPIGLDRIAKVLHADVQKDSEGSRLIKLFSIPNKAGQRVIPDTEELKLDWLKYAKYNVQDVLAEMSVNGSLFYVHVPAWHELLYKIDQDINDRGVKIDIIFVSKIVEILNLADTANYKKFFLVSGVVNAKSNVQVKDYIENILRRPIDGTDKKSLTDLLAEPNIPAQVREFIQLKLSLSKTSTAKFTKMLELADKDTHRAKGLFQFNGATRTGRWAGRAIQLQNLPRISLKGDLAVYREIIKNKPADAVLDTINLMHGEASFFISQMIRPSFIAEEGHTFAIADFAGIENRILAWMAGETWKVQAFAEGRDVYIETAIKMFNLDASKDYKSTPERQKGKVCELALGYQGGIAALIRSGILPTVEEELTTVWQESDILQTKYREVSDFIEVEKDREIQSLVTGWRAINGRIVRFWYDVQKAAILALKGQPNEYKGLRFYMKAKNLVIRLLSGRELYYPNAGIEQGAYGDSIYYYGQSDGGKWQKRSTYGGSLVENIVQATAADCLAWLMLRVESRGVKIVIHVHDEIVAEVDEVNSQSCLDFILQTMETPIPWAKGLKLIGEGKLSDYYTK